MVKKLKITKNGSFLLYLTLFVLPNRLIYI